jgi:hypothetical protein
LGIGDWGLGPIPNPQSPIPNPQSPIPKSKMIIIKFHYFEVYKKRKEIIENQIFYHKYKK